MNSPSTEHLERFQDPARAAAALHLSMRERETLQLIAEGSVRQGKVAHVRCDRTRADSVGFLSTGSGL
jgi:hypothetical protein